MDGGGGQKETGLERVLHGNTRSLRRRPLLLLRIRSAHLEIVGFPMGGAF